ncbi:hypothetical protein Lal_00026606 [Lupinus albus]|nr:hypothetical protein Lal_00026606 [Lupinus albus]
MRNNPKVGAGIGGTFKVTKDQTQHSPSDVANFGSSNVANFGSSNVANFGSSNVAKFSSSDVASFGSSDVASFGSSYVASFGSCDVASFDSSYVAHFGSSDVASFGSTNFGSSNVANFGSSNVANFGSSNVANFGSSDVASFGSSYVASFGSSDVASFGSSYVAHFVSSDVASFGSSYVANFGSSYATFDDGEENKDYILKTAGKALRKFITDVRKCLRDANGNVNLKPLAKYENLIDKADWVEFVKLRTQDDKFLKVSEENLKRASNPLYPCRVSRMGYRGVEEKIVTRTKRDTFGFECRRPRYLWVDVRKNKQGVIDIEQVQEVANLDGISSCKLFLDIPITRAVGIGTVYNTRDTMLHNAQIPCNHVMVSIDIPIEEYAFLPIPLDEDIITIGGAIGTYVAWTIHLVDVVPIKTPCQNNDKDCGYYVMNFMKERIFPNSLLYMVYSTTQVEGCSAE